MSEKEDLRPVKLITTPMGKRESSGSPSIHYNMFTDDPKTCKILNNIQAEQILKNRTPHISVEFDKHNFEAALRRRDSDVQHGVEIQVD